MARRWGTRGDDSLTGTNGKDILVGGRGDDTLKGGRGDDLLFGGHGDDTLKGGRGDDWLFGGHGDDTLKGGRGDDWLFGGQGDDTLKGGRGDDWLFGGHGDDRLHGGSGDDILFGGIGADRLKGGAGDDILIGDSLGYRHGHGHRGRGSGSGSHCGSRGGSASGSGYGITFDDYLDGGTGSDIVYGGWGDDRGFWRLSQNIGETDFYDGGRGFDTLVLKFTADEFARADVQAELAALDTFIANHANPWTDWGPVFTFEAAGATLHLQDWEAYRVKVTGGPTNGAPNAVDDVTAVSEGGTLAVTDPLLGLLNNDSDPDLLDTISVIGFDALSALGATVTVNPDGTYTYDATGLFDGLAVGETLSDTFTYTIADQAGASDTATVTVTVTGINDAPTVQDVALAATEGGSAVGGSFAGDDIDSDDDASTLVYTITSAPAEGSVINNGDGTFDFDPGADFQDLALGETRDVSFTYAAADIHGAFSNSGTVTVTVTGTNDAPEITFAAGEDEGTVVEDDVSNTVTGQLDGNDVDNGASEFWTVLGGGTGTYGMLTVDGTGQWTYTLDNSNPLLDSLDTGESETDVFTVELADEHGAVDTQIVTVTIEGNTDNQLVVAVDDNHFATENGPPTNNAVLANDSIPDGVGSVSIVTAPALGLVTVNPDFTIDFDPNGGFNFLAVGEVGTTTYVYEVTDVDGDSDTATVTVFVDGLNDAPDITVAPGDGADGSVKEIADNAPGENVDDLAASGTITFDDVDLIDTHSITVSPNGVGYIGAFNAVIGTAATGSGAGSIDWDFTVNDGLLDSLNEGEQIVQSYDVAILDNNGLSDTQTVTITIEGTNDAPVVQDVTVTGAFEDGPTVTDSFDGDDGDNEDNPSTLAYDITSAPSEGSVVNNGDGTFTFDPGSDFQDLADGETRDVTFDYTATDAQGAVSSTGTVTVTVTGANDGPVATSDTFSANEDTIELFGAPGVLGNDADVEGDVLTVTGVGPVSIVGGGLLPSTLIEMNPDGGFRFRPDVSLDIQSIAAGDTVDVTFDYTVSDGSLSDTGTVTLTVAGENDDPVASGGISFNLFENGPDVTIGGVGDDIDTDDDIDSLSYAILSQPALGTVTPLAGRLFTFSDLDDFDHLAAGEVATVFVDYQVTDSHGALSNIATIAINVTGLNDDPTVADVQLNAVEDGPGVDGSFVGDDADSDDDGSTLTYTVTTAPSEGSVVNNNDGTFTFEPGTDFQDLALNETRDVTFAYTATDSHGAVSAAATVTVTVTGTNDAPEITFVAGNDAGAVVEDDPGNTVSGQLTGADVDNNAVLTWSVAGGGIGTYGNLSVDASGYWTYTLDNATPELDALNDGQNAVESFDVTVTDEHGATDTQTVTVTVNGTSDNNGPFAIDDNVATDEDTAITIQVLANDSDPDGDPISAMASTNPANGVLVHNELDDTYTYTPDQDFVGTDSFEYTISDGQAGFDTATVTITVNPVNDVPVIGGDLNIIVTEDGSVGLTATDLSAFDPDDADSAVTFTLSDAPGGGTLFNGATALGVNDTFSLADIVAGNITYDHGGSEGDDSFIVTVSDDEPSTGGSATVGVTVININDAPVAVDDNVVTDEETPIVIDLLANDSDSDGDPINPTITTNPSNGLLVHNVVDNTYTYTPDPDFVGSDSFTYTIDDGQGATDTATVNITVSPVNDAPVFAGDLNIVVDEGGLVSVTSADLSAIDPDDADSAVTFTLTGTPSGGTLFNGGTALGANDTFSLADIVAGNITYDHDGSEGDDGFTLDLSDDDPASGGSATVSVTVNNINDVPVAVDDAVVTDEETPVVIDVLANDSDGDGDPINPASSTNPANGILVFNALDGTFTYTPDLDFVGTDSFDYTISDGQGGFDTATVDITVNPVNDAPVFGGDLSITVTEGGLVSVTSVDLSAIDPDDAASAITFNLTGAPSGGTLFNGGTALAQNDSFSLADIVAGNISYDHDGSEGDDSFTVAVSDDEPASGGSATVNVTVINVNDPPVAADDTVAVDEETATVIDVLANDNDPDGDPLAIIASTNPANGVLVLNALHDTFTYTANADFVGTDSFTYTISDGQGGFDTATVDITVNPVNDAPTPGGDLLISVIEGGLVSVTTADLTAVDPDDADAALSFTLTGTPAGGTLFNGGTALAQNDSFSLADIIAGNITYDHDGSEGDDSFTLDVSDDEPASGGAVTVNVSVTNINDAPDAVDDAVVTDEETAIVIDVLANDTDLDGDDLTPIASTNPANGLLTYDSGTKLYTYTPNLDFVGSDSFTYTISDGKGGLDTGTVNITVNPVNDIPVFGGDLAIEVNQAGQVVLNTSDLSAFDPDDANGDVAFVLNGAPTDGTLFNGATALGASDSFTLADIVAGNVSYDHSGTGGSADSFVVEVFDDEPSSGGTATINVTVATVPAPPVAVTDNYIIAQDAANVLMDLIANDTDANDDPLSPIASTNPANGFLGFIVADETYFYIPTAGFSGTDSFTYTITDGNGGFDVGAVNITTVASGSALVGSGADEIFQGNALDDILTGGGGDDLFQFDDGDGDDTITDFSAGAGDGDRLDVREFGFTDLADLLSAADDGNGANPDTVIALDADDSVTLIGVQKSDLDADDFLF